MPTSVSVNEVFANSSPADRSSSRILEKGDLVKIDLGAHIDGFVAAAAYTAVCCSSNATAFGAGLPAAAAASAAAAAQEQLASQPPAAEMYVQQQQNTKEQQQEPIKTVEGPAAAVLKAAWVATEAALRKMEIGGRASDVTKVVERVAKEFDIKPMHVRSILTVNQLIKC